MSKDGKVVDSWDDLSSISTDKLIKLRDVAADNMRELASSLEEERMHHVTILMELSKRKDR